MRISGLALIGGLLLVAAPTYAQDEGGDAATTEASAEGAAAEGTEETAEEAKTDEAKSSEGSGQYVSSEQRFPIRRGFYTQGDFGIFVAFGGRNSNAPGIPSRSTSNLQPYIGLTVGYDLMSDEKINIAAGLKVGYMMNGGASRATANDVTGAVGDPSTLSNDFEVWQVGVGGAFDYLLTDRLGLAFKLDGGLALLSPDPFEFANIVGGSPEDAVQRFPNAGKSAIGGLVGVSAGVSYATLLTGFTVGVDVRFNAIIAGSFIPALSATVPIKYNF